MINQLIDWSIIDCLKNTNCLIRKWIKARKAGWLTKIIDQLIDWLIDWFVSCWVVSDYFMNDYLILIDELKEGADWSKLLDWLPNPGSGWLLQLQIDQLITYWLTHI